MLNPRYKGRITGSSMWVWERPFQNCVLPWMATPSPQGWVYGVFWTGLSHSHCPLAHSLLQNNRRTREP